MNEQTSPPVNPANRYPFRVDPGWLTVLSSSLDLHFTVNGEGPETLDFKLEVIHPGRLPEALRALDTVNNAEGGNETGMQAGTRLRRASALLLFFEGEKLFIHHYLSRQTMSCSPECAGFLAALDPWQTVAETAGQLARFSRDSVIRCLTTLVQHSVVLMEGSPADNADAFFRKNWHWGHEGAFFHFGTKYREVISPELHRAIQKFRAKLDPSPPLHTRNAQFQPEVPLTRPVPRGQLYETMAARRTNRDLADEPVPLEAINHCLFYSLCVTGMISSPDIIDLPLKMTPSGGARNPFEAYVYVRRVSGLEQGIYHYSAMDHSLGKLAVPRFPALSDLCADGQEGTEHAAAAIFLVGCLDRVMWKYRHPFSYRTVLIEAGHIAQNIMLAAVSQGLTANPTGAFHEDVLEDVLQINPVKQSAFYSLLIGKPLN